MLYERTKRELAAREWKYVQHYADAKTRGRRGDHRAGRWPTRRADRVDSDARAIGYRPRTHMNHLLLLSMPGMIVPGR